MKVQSIRVDREECMESCLNKEDSEFLRGYDWCIEMAVDNFFNNLELLDSDYMEKFLAEPLPEFKRDEYIVTPRFIKEDAETRKVETYGDYLRLQLLEWIEAERQGLVISMIDGLDEEDVENESLEVGNDD